VSATPGRPPAGSAPARRLFIALWPGDRQRAAIARGFAAALAAAGGRAVRPENLHLTLAFLGSVPQAEVERIAAIGAGLELPRSGLVLERAECWPRARVLVAAASAPAEWLALQAELTTRLKAAGFSVDSGAWRPHVTLARKVAATTLPAIGGPVDWPLEALALIASEPAATGSRYQPLAVWRPGG
jgi:2'-5' RNA ligase